MNCATICISCWCYIIRTSIKKTLIVCFKNKNPKVGETVSTPNGKGKIVSIDCIKETFNVELSENNIKTFKASQIKKI